MSTKAYTIQEKSRLESKSEFILSLLSDPWHIVSETMAKMGRDVSESQKLYEDLIERSSKTNTVRFWFVDGAPVMMVGAVQYDDYFSTFFCAHRAFETYGIPLTKGIKRWLRNEAELRPNTDLIIWSRSRHDRRDRWFQTLGFEKVRFDAQAERYLFKLKH
jgi:hypothetical protein